MALKNITVSASLALVLYGCGDSGAKKQEDVPVAPGQESLKLTKIVVEEMAEKNASETEVVAKIQAVCAKLDGKVKTIDTEETGEKTVEEVAELYRCVTDKHTAQPIALKNLGPESEKKIPVAAKLSEEEQNTTSTPTLPVAALNNCDDKLHGTAELERTEDQEAQCFINLNKVETLKLSDEKRHELVEKKVSEEEFVLEFEALCNVLSGVVNTGDNVDEEVSAKAVDFSCEIDRSLNKEIDVSAKLEVKVPSQDEEETFEGEVEEVEEVTVAAICKDQLKGVDAFVGYNGVAKCRVAKNKCHELCDAALQAQVETTLSPEEIDENEIGSLLDESTTLPATLMSDTTKPKKKGSSSMKNE